MCSCMCVFVCVCVYVCVYVCVCVCVCMRARIIFTCLSLCVVLGCNAGQCRFDLCSPVSFVSVVLHAII